MALKLAHDRSLYFYALHAKHTIPTPRPSVLGSFSPSWASVHTVAIGHSTILRFWDRKHPEKGCSIVRRQRLARALVYASSSMPALAKLHMMYSITSRAHSSASSPSPKHVPTTLATGSTSASSRGSPHSLGARHAVVSLLPAQKFCEAAGCRVCQPLCDVLPVCCWCDALLVGLSHGACKRCDLTKRCNGPTRQAVALQTREDTAAAFVGDHLEGQLEPTKDETCSTGLRTPISHVKAKRIENPRAV